ncbi:MAG: biopolymer transporter ExbD [Negativicutes bacterium]|nr:biopolymer transporter ExbD [Negativicutes bacterium]
MRLKKRRVTRAPELMISPMIDMMFLLLVFFIVATMNMAEIKTIDVKLPVAKSSSLETKTTFNVTVKADGSIWLGERQTDLETLVMQAALESKNDPGFAVIISGDGDGNYRNIVSLLDHLKQAKVTRVGLATELGDGK